MSLKNIAEKETDENVIEITTFEYKFWSKFIYFIGELRVWHPKKIKYSGI